MKYSGTRSLTTLKINIYCSYSRLPVSVSQIGNVPCKTKLVIGPFEFPSQIWLGFKLSNYKLSVNTFNRYVIEWVHVGGLKKPFKVYVRLKTL